MAQKWPPIQAKPDRIQPKPGPIRAKPEPIRTGPGLQKEPSAQKVIFGHPVAYTAKKYLSKMVPRESAVLVRILRLYTPTSTCCFQQVLVTKQVLVGGNKYLLVG